MRLCLSFTLLLCLLLAGCATYQPQPLSHADVVTRLKELDKSAPESGTMEFSFLEAAELLDKNSRKLSEIKESYKTLKDVADIPTPWLNPALNVGFKHGNHLPNDFSGATQPVASLVFSIPLSGRLSKNDDLNKALAEEKSTVLKVEHRKLFLELHQVYGKVYFLQEKEQVLEKLIKFVRWKRDEAKRLETSGFYSALDSGVIEQQLDVVQSRRFIVVEQLLEAEQKLAVLLDLPATFFNNKQLEKPVLFDDTVSADLEKVLLENHLNLAKIRSSYQVVEKQLRLEVAKQYPDLKIGGNYNREPGEEKEFFGLAIGLELPIFDRNQVNIAKFMGKRRELFKSYEKEVSEALISSKYLLKQLVNSYKKHQHQNNEVLAQASKNRDLARKSFESDQISLLRYWEFEENYINQQLNFSESFLNLWQQQTKFELLLGNLLENQKVNQKTE